jgi:5-formyltetrahydrofolate cyclo-ligase
MNSLQNPRAELLERKRKMRQAAYKARDAQPDKQQVSRQIISRFLGLPEYAHADTVMWYVHCRSEVRTRHALPAAIAGEKRIVVPYCTVDEQGAAKLGLWLLEDLDELVPGTWKIPEPPRERWGEPGKEIDPAALDLVMVPGVAFSREGGRLGNGQGYYDRLLEQVRPDCRLIAVCYESQLFDDLSLSPRDVFMDKLVTEKALYECRGRR